MTTIAPQPLNRSARQQQSKKTPLGGAAATSLDRKSSSGNDPIDLSQVIADRAFKQQLQQAASSSSGAPNGNRSAGKSLSLAPAGNVPAAAAAAVTIQPLQ